MAADDAIDQKERNAFAPISWFNNKPKTTVTGLS
jgi:hypothetical protein